MGTTVLVDLPDFIKDLLPPLSDDALTLPENTLENAKSVLDKLFYSDTDPKKKLEPLENPIAEAVVDIINTIVPTYNYKAHLSRYRKQQTDVSGYKVDAGLYTADKVPSTETPDWTHCRFFIEFKGAKRQYDPWDDRSSQPETFAKDRANTRAQLISYAHKLFLYQHRTALFSLVIFGDHFRAARWDRSGVIVSKKVNYLEDTKALLQLVVRLAKLDEEWQGIDSTAELIPPDTAAFRLMDELAEPNSEEDMDYMEPGTEDYVPPPAFPPVTSVLLNPSSTSSGTAGVSATPQVEEAGASLTEESKPKAPRAKHPRTKKATAKDPDAAQEPPEDTSEALPEAPDPDLAGVETWRNVTKPVFRYVRDRFRRSLVPGWPRYKLKIRYNGEDRLFLVAKPTFESSSMFGRATRGYIAVDTTTGLFIFLKDSWRPFYDGVEPEGVYLERFAGDDHISVPTILCHGDVENQCAYTAQYKDILKKREDDLRRSEGPAVSTSSSAKQVNKKKRPLPLDNTATMSPNNPSPSLATALRHHIHYRIAVRDVCLPFEEFRTTEQLIRLMYNCISTHYHVYKKHELLHRDISSGNVLILPRHITTPDGKKVVVWRGVLTDWELAKPYLKDRTLEKARQPERTGTWQFMSVAYINSQFTHPIAVADELESFFHVMLFFAVRFLPHFVDGGTALFVMQYFDTFQVDDGDIHSCGYLKQNAMYTGVIGPQNEAKKLKFLTNSRTSLSPLNNLITHILMAFRARYKVLEYEAKLSKKEPLKLDDSLAAIPANNNEPEMWLPPMQLEPLEEMPWNEPGEQIGPIGKDSGTSLIPPTDEEKTLAAKLEAHKWVLMVFQGIRDRTQTPPAMWKEAWVVQDQLVGYEPRIILQNMKTAQVTGARGTGDGSSKRIKTSQSSYAVPTASGELPGTRPSFSGPSGSGQPRT